MVKEVVQRAIGQMREGKNELVPKNMLINKKLDAEDAGAIAEELKVNKSLTTLGLDHNAIGASGASSIGEALKVNGSLTSLHLLQNSIGDPGASSIGEALKDNQSLTELDLGANSIGASGASSIGEALKDNASLTELNLRGNSIGDPGASSIGEALKVNRSLTDLDLALNSIGDPGGSSIGEALKVNGSLTELSLFRNEIGDPGAFSIGEALKVNASLTVLSLGANSIGGPGASSIGEALKDNRSLTELDLSDNDIEDPAEATDATCILAGLLSSANLVTLDVRDNKLTRIPADAFLRCTKLAAPVDSYGDTINPFSSNPWTHPPAEIVDQGLEAVREYLQRIQSEGAERCAVAKMMLVGLGEAGKTSFLNAIRSADGKSASIDRADRTVGIDLHAWEPDTATLEAALGAERAGTLAGLRINACDMAGQDEYGVTHQLFLTPRSFYVLVFDAKRAHDDGESREARQDSVDRWLESIQARSPAAQVLLVATHVDELTSDQVDAVCTELATHVAARVGAMRLASVVQAESATETLVTGDADDPRPRRTPETGPRPDAPKLTVEQKLARKRDALRFGAPLVIGASATAVRAVGLKRFAVGLADDDNPDAETILASGHADRDGEVAAILDAVVRVNCLKDASSIDAARRKILDCVSRMPDVGLELPKSYLTVRKFLNAQRDTAATTTEIFTHTADMFNRLTSEADIDRGTFDAALRFWHDLGEVYLHDHLVFVDPARVFTIVKSVVRSRQEFGKWAPKASKTELCSDFNSRLCGTEAVLTERLLREHLWQSAGCPYQAIIDASDADKKSFVSLLENFGVLIRLPGGTSGGDLGEAWLVPSMIKPESAAKAPPESHAASPHDGLFVRRFTFPSLPFGFVQRIHATIKLDANVSANLGYSWGRVFSLTQLPAAAMSRQQRPECVYRLEPPGAADCIFAPEQFDRGEVGNHLIKREVAGVVLTVESSSETLLWCVLKAVRATADTFFAGVLAREWLETPVVIADRAREGAPADREARVARRRLHLAVSPKLDDDLRGARRGTISGIPCAGPNGTVDLALLRSGVPPDVFISYDWGPDVDSDDKSKEGLARLEVRDRIKKEREPIVTALQSAIESRLHLRCWRDKQRMDKGHNVKDEMRRGVCNASVFLFCLTAEYIRDSPNCMHEYRTAKAEGKPMVLVVLEPGGFPTHKELEAEAEVSDWAQWRKDRWRKFRTEWTAEQRATLAEMVEIFFVERSAWVGDEQVDQFTPSAVTGEPGTWSDRFVTDLGTATMNAIGRKVQPAIPALTAAVRHVCYVRVQNSASSSALKIRFVDADTDVADLLAIARDQSPKTLGRHDRSDLSLWTGYGRGATAFAVDARVCEIGPGRTAGDALCVRAPGVYSSTPAPLPPLSLAGVFVRVRRSSATAIRLPVASDTVVADLLGLARDRSPNTLGRYDPGQLVLSAGFGNHAQRFAGDVRVCEIGLGRTAREALCVRAPKRPCCVL